jgi:hypothetical protein
MCCNKQYSESEGNVNWIHLTQNTDQWRAPVKMAMDLQFYSEYFLRLPATPAVASSPLHESVPSGIKLSRRESSMAPCKQSKFPKYKEVLKMLFLHARAHSLYRLNTYVGIHPKELFLRSFQKILFICFL